MSAPCRAASPLATQPSLRRLAMSGNNLATDNRGSALGRLSNANRSRAALDQIATGALALNSPRRYRPHKRAQAKW
jgi:hypothetical protein